MYALSFSIEFNPIYFNFVSNHKNDMYDVRSKLTIYDTLYHKNNNISN